MRHSALFKHFALLLFLFLSLSTWAQHMGVVDLPLQNWKFSEAGKDDWKPATVPGNIHLDLLNNKLIPDPTYGENYKKCQWVEQKDWEYATILNHDSVRWHVLNGANAELVFEGLDTYADIFLNDSLILHTENMFRMYTLRVEKILKQGDNKLRIRFHSPPAYVREHMMKSGIRYPADNDSTAPYTRKSPLQYGWDFAPRMLTCGIRQKAHILYWHDLIIRDVQMTTQQLSKARAEMMIHLTLESTRPDTVLIAVEAFQISAHVPVSKGTSEIHIPFTIEHPSLWWPAGMGEPNMYEIAVSAIGKQYKSFRRVSFGLRTVELVNETDSIGTSFFFRVNGKPLYIKGANILPPPLLQKVSDYNTSIQSQFTDLPLNMIRVWGGGVYGDGELYHYADQNGILVWQDFMFSGTLYPGDSAFLQNVEAEARDNILRLRNHPSLALWCGNNEIEVAWKNWGWQKTFHYSTEDTTRLMKDYNSLFRQLLPRLITFLDNGRSYLPSSPISNWGKAGDFKKGDNHYWGVWHGEEDFGAYNTHVGRFMSEFGFPSFPSVNSIRHFNGETNPDVNSPVMKAHQFSYKGNGLIEKYIDRHYRKPKDFESFVYLSQLLQAEGMKTAIEAQRRNKPACMGSLFWQWNDYWPSVSWSVMDYYGDPKAGFYAAYKAFAPVLLSAWTEKGMLRINAVTDDEKTRSGELVIEVSDLYGKHKTEIKKNVKFKGNERIFSQLMQSGNPEKNTKTTALLDGYDLTDCVLSYSMALNKDTSCSGIFYFTEPKNLQLPQPHITFTIKKVDDHFVLYVKSDVLAKNVFITTTEGTGALADENYVDLLPGKEKSIIFFSDLSEEKLKKGIVLKSLWDTYSK
ncbi:MAG: glycosyl hydrolase 2 galactose-binding domain-containing protein [Bacteroidia bacterium]